MILSKYATAAFSNATGASIHIASLRSSPSPAEAYQPPLYLQAEQHKPCAVTEAKPVELPTTRRSLNAEDRHVFDTWAMRVALFYFLVALICVVTGWLRYEPSVHREAPQIVELPPVQGLER